MVMRYITCDFPEALDECAFQELDHVIVESKKFKICCVGQ